MRKSIFTCLVVLSVLYFSAACAFGAPLWESDTTQTITSGVQLRKLDRFYQNTWDQIRVLYVDLDNPYIDLRVLTAKNGTSARETTLSMAQRTGAVAAVNGDFFNMFSGPTNMLGMVVQNGEMMSSPSKDVGLANFALLADNSVVMDYFSFHGSIQSPQGCSSDLYAINKLPVTTGGITMLTPAWGAKTTGDLDGVTMTEMVVVDDIVQEIRTGLGETFIPENGYILVTNSNINGFLRDNFCVGDRVQIDTMLSPDAKAIREATGGGTVLVKNGQIAQFTNNIAGFAQRTAVGIDKSGKTLMLVTVDGRLAECEGMNQTELAQVLIELGCDTALNLDGGSSTTMVARERFSGELQVQNTLVGSMRAVSTSIGIFENAPTGAPRYIVAEALAEAVAVGSGVQINYTICDAYDNNVYVPAEAVHISADKPAYIEGNTVFPQADGLYTVTVSSGGAQTQVSFYSVGAYTNLMLYPQVAQIKVGESYKFALVGTDAQGHKVTLPAANAVWQIDGEAFAVDAGNVRALKQGNANVCVDFGGLTAYASVATPEAEMYNKPADVYMLHADYGEASGYSICVLGSIQTRGTLLEHIFHTRSMAQVERADAAYRLGDYSGDENGIEKIEGFTKKRINNTLLLTVSNAKSGSIKKTDAAQWEKLIAAVENASESNIVLMLQHFIYNMESGEIRVMEAILSEAARKGKRVYLIYEGDEARAVVDNGVTHLTVGAMENLRAKTAISDVERFASLRLTLSPEGVRFTYE